MTHFFDRKDRWGNGTAVWVVMAMLFIAPLAAWSIRQTRLENDVEQWLPEGDREAKIQDWVRSQFPAEERIIVSWNDSSLNDPRIPVFIEKLQGTLDSDGIRRGGFPHIARVVEPRDLLLAMEKNGVEPREAMHRLQGLIIGAGSLKLKLTDFGNEGLKRTIQELKSAAKAKFGIDLEFSDSIPDFWTHVAIPAPPAAEGETQPEPAAPAIMNAAGDLIDDQSIEHDLQIAWKGIRPGTKRTSEIADWLTQFTPAKDQGQHVIERCFFALGSPVSVAVSISEAGLADKIETISVIRRAAAEAGISPEALHLGGKTILGTELHHEAGKAIWDPSFPLGQFHRRSVILSSVILCVGLGCVLLRSIRLAAIVATTAAFAGSISVALVSATGGTMNMALILAPCLLMVITLSCSIHFANYWKYAACGNDSTAVQDAVRAAWIPCLLAGVATAIGLLALGASPLTPVRVFGVYASAGAILSVGATLFCLPALMQLWPGQPPVDRGLGIAAWRLVGNGLTFWPLLQSLVVVAACIVCCCGLTHVRTEAKVIRNLSERSRIVQDYWFLENNLTGLLPFDAIIRFDAQSQKDTTFLDRLEVVRGVQERLRKTPEITGSLSLADLLPVSKSLEENAGSLARMKHRKQAEALQESIRGGDVPAARTLYTLADKAQDLAQAGDGKLNEKDDELWRITLHATIMDDDDFARILADVHRNTQDVLKLHPGSIHTVYGPITLLVSMQRDLRLTLAASLGLACALILGLFLIVVRNFWAGIVALIPGIVPIIAVLGTISWLGQKMDLGTMMSASIALGIATPGTLHLLTWFRSGMRVGQSRRESVISALVHSGPAIWRTSLSAAIGMLVLAQSDLPMISRFGSLMAVMIGAAFLGEIILLPQLLAGPLGGLFEPPGNKSPVESIVNSNSADKAPPPTLPAPHFTPRSPSESPRPAS